MVWSEGVISAGTVAITLRESATIERRVYRLGDLAIITADDARVVEKFSSLDVGVAPQPGYVDVLTRWELRRVVESKLPGFRDQIQWGGAESLRLRSIGISYDSEKISGIAKQFLHERLKEQYAQVNIDVIRGVDTLILPSGKVEFKPRIDEPLTVRKRVAVWIDVLVEGRHYTTLPVWFSASAFMHVLVSKKNIQRGVEIRQEDFDKELREATLIDGAPLTNNLAGYRLKRGIQPGDPLLKNNVEAVPVINRNQSVLIKVLSGAIEVEGQGMALSDGQMGEVIEVVVKNGGPRDRFKAKVVGTGVVLIGGR